MISTLIVEDDYHVASIHAAYVRKVRGFKVAGHASTAASARTEIRRLAPALVLLMLFEPMPSLAPAKGATARNAQE